MAERKVFVLSKRCVKDRDGREALQAVIQVEDEFLLIIQGFQPNEKGGVYAWRKGAAYWLLENEKQFPEALRIPFAKRRIIGAPVSDLAFSCGL